MDAEERVRRRGSGLLALVIVGMFTLGYAAGSQLIRREDYDREIEQAGLVAAPGGPHAVGPLVDEHRLALEGALSGGGAFAPTRSREDGASGQMSELDWARLRLAGSPTAWMELGVEVSGSPGLLVG